MGGGALGGEGRRGRGRGKAGGKRLSSAFGCYCAWDGCGKRAPGVWVREDGAGYGSFIIQAEGQRKGSVSREEGVAEQMKLLTSRVLFLKFY